MSIFINRKKRAVLLSVCFSGRILQGIYVQNLSVSDCFLCFTDRRYASVVYGMAMCLSVRPSV